MAVEAGRDRALGALLGAAVGDAGAQRHLRRHGSALREALAISTACSHATRRWHHGCAVGAFLEFRSQISREDVEAALALPGGGCFDVGPGQVGRPPAAWPACGSGPACYGTRRMRRI